jgi:hypothetical protein
MVTKGERLSQRWASARYWDVQSECLYQTDGLQTHFFLWMIELHHIKGYANQSTCQIDFASPQDNSEVLSLKIYTIGSTPVQIITHH